MIQLSVILLPVMPSKSIETINLHDATFENSLVYVKNRLGEEAMTQETTGFIQTLGGRRTDLELFIQKIRAGSNPMEAFNDIIIKSVAEIRKQGLGEGEFRNEVKSPWNPVQFWMLVELLAKYEMVHVIILFVFE